MPEECKYFVRSGSPKRRQGGWSPRKTNQPRRTLTPDSSPGHTLRRGLRDSPQGGRLGEVCAEGKRNSLGPERVPIFTLPGCCPHLSEGTFVDLVHLHMSRLPPPKHTFPEGGGQDSGSQSTHPGNEEVGSDGPNYTEGPGVRGTDTLPPLLLSRDTDAPHSPPDVPPRVRVHSHMRTTGNPTHDTDVATE